MADKQKPYSVSRSTWRPSAEHKAQVNANLKKLETPAPKKESAPRKTVQAKATPAPSRHEKRYQSALQGRTRRRERQVIRSESVPYRAGRAVSRGASSVTQHSDYSGKGMLTAELLIGFGIILIRIAGDFTVDPSTGKAKSNVLHNPGQKYGPFPIAIGLLGTFFVLSFFAASGGTKAKFAVIFGGAVVTALGVKSAPEIDKIASTIGHIGTISVPAATGTTTTAASSGTTSFTNVLNMGGTTGTTPPNTGTLPGGTIVPPGFFPGGTAPTGPGTATLSPVGGNAGTLFPTISPVVGTTGVPVLPGTPTGIPGANAPTGTNPPGRLPPGSVGGRL